MFIDDNGAGTRLGVPAVGKAICRRPALFNTY